MKIAALSPYQNRVESSRKLINFPGWQVGTMFIVPAGTRYHLPFLPDLPTDGIVWITQVSGDRLELHEELKIAGIPAQFTSVLERDGASNAVYTMSGTLFGRRLPKIVQRYDILDAHRGFLELRSTGKLHEKPSTLHLKGDTLFSDVAGPFGIRSPRAEKMIQPGQAGYSRPSHFRQSN